VNTGGRLLGADWLLLLGARGRALASSAVAATRAPLSTATALAAAIAIGGLRATSASGPCWTLVRQCWRSLLRWRQ